MGNTLMGCGGIGQNQDGDNIPYGKPTSVNKSKYYTEQDMNNKLEDDSTLKTVKQNETSDASTANNINEKNYDKIISENNLTQTNLDPGKPTSVNKSQNSIEQNMDNTQEYSSTLKTVKQDETSCPKTANNRNERNPDKAIAESDLTKTKLVPINDPNNTHEHNSNLKRVTPVKKKKRKSNSDKKITEKDIAAEQQSSQNIGSNEEVLSNVELNYENMENQKLLMSSSIPEIKSCGESINNILNELMPLKLFHKTTNYKRIDRELFNLMVKLDDIEADDNSVVREERRKALIEIYGMHKLLDSKIQCKITDCIICKTGIDFDENELNVSS